MTGVQTLPAAVREAAAQYADHPAVVDGDTTLTFASLRQQVRDAARGYVALGVRPGDRVAIWAPNTWHWIVAGLAVSHAGATLVPLNTRYKGHEVIDVLDRTGATLAIIADGFLGRSQVDELQAAAGELRDAGDLGTEGEVVAGLPGLRAIVRISDDAAPGNPPGTVAFVDLASVGASVSDDQVDAIADAVTGDDIADILFTSGTTGRSKGVLSAHSQTISASAVWAATGQVSDADRYLVISPFFHSYGYKVGIVTSILTGCTLYPMAAFDAGEALRLIADEQITMVPGAPTIFHSLLEHPDFATTDTSSLRFANTGAASVPVALVERMQSELSFDLVITAFGMTECVTATMCRPGDDDHTIATTCGRVVDGLELRIVDPESGRVLGAGEEGEVQFRGPMVMRGYLDDPEATAATIEPDGWLHTGDVGSVDERGYLRITDRLKDMYISGGFNVYPAEVEQVLARLDGVVEAAVIGVPDERMGEVGKAHVVRRDGADVTVEDVIAFAKERLANFKVPRVVEFVDALPRNLGGKVLKTQLREQHEPGKGQD
ncbi:FadD3 family acyl-CoA ligase [Nocardioides sp. AE5]|uniref:FadD3 family acyl-CoA ligase n=1 Tax=Nocardioides sp. AE5 TaxID=2962573 RepID=UPI0028816643|nr:FadD3 family acyl-CoA ligase [Nocardioides sp. AE5]MDT0201612.1 FadD3 family acyl-CoA ligase [Nocardioides sp. AE5]